MDPVSQAALIRAALPTSDTPTFGGHKPMRLPDSYIQHDKARPFGTTTNAGSDPVGRSLREFRYPYLKPDTASGSDSYGDIEPPGYARRPEDDRLKERDVYFERSRRSEEGLRAFHMEDRSSTSQPSYEMSARDYVERSRGRTKPYQESARRSSPQRVSPKDKVEYIRRSDGRPAAMKRRGSGSSRSSPLPRKPALRTKRSFMHSDPVLEAGLSPQIYPTISPFDQPRPAGPNPKGQRRESPHRGSPRRDPERSRRLSNDYERFRLTPRQRADTMPVHVNSGRKRETPSSSSKAQKSSGLGRTEWTDEMPTSSSPRMNPYLEFTGELPDDLPTSSSPTPEPVLLSHNVKYPYGRGYADDHEFVTSTFRRTREGVHTKQRNGGALSSGYISTQQRTPQPASRTTSYVYTPEGLRGLETPLARLGLERKEAMPKSLGLLVSHTVSRDDTSSEDAKASSMLRTFMEPHMSYLES